ncbi:hypothetical protein F4677DRAFT_241137 [Hypoxylon crocopeplum]|nr:hypothetical protein F4677DRAFT_241137 [Hypoxylon crocopeplum]
MMASYESIYPLRKVSREDFTNLCEVLWNWRPCTEWAKEGDCQRRLRRIECPCQKADGLTAFFDFYRNTTAHYVPELTNNSVLTLRTHSDLQRVIESIKSYPNKPRLQLTKEHFGHYETWDSQGLPSDDENRAFNLATRVMTMLQCSVEGQSDGLLEAGSQPTIWRSDQSFNQFINSAIPKRSQVSFESHNDTSPSIILPSSSITAKRLKTVAKLKLIPTDDVRDHLLLNERNGTVAVYHYTSVLKEHLGISQDQDARTSSEQAAAQYTALPGQLLTETLNSLKYVLFPIEPESQSILRSLVARDGFDPDNCGVDASSWKPLEGEPLRYEYWGARLMRLYDELEHPTPRGFLESWLERRSGARYVMFVTLIGVLIAIMLGILSLAVSIFQAWVSWQQWQHPVA